MYCKLSQRNEKGKECGEGQRSYDVNLDNE